MSSGPKKSTAKRVASQQTTITSFLAKATSSAPSTPKQPAPRVKEAEETPVAPKKTATPKKNAATPITKAFARASKSDPPPVVPDPEPAEKVEADNDTPVTSPSKRTKAKKAATPAVKQTTPTPPPAAPAPVVEPTPAAPAPAEPVVSNTPTRPTRSSSKKLASPPVAVVTPSEPVAVAAEEAEPDPQEPATPAQKKRGRPKKSATPATPAEIDRSDSDDDDQEDADTPRSPKKLRGRPPRSSMASPSPAERTGLTMTPVKRQLEVQLRDIWEPPHAPGRIGRSLLKLTSTSNYSIGQHMQYGSDRWDQFKLDHLKRVSVHPYPHWRCLTKDLFAISAESRHTYLSGDKESVSFEFTYGPNTAPEDPIVVDRLAGHRKDTRGTDFFLNAGGPVIDLEWCPLPWSALAKDKLPKEPSLMHSFIAVSTTKSQARPNECGATSNERNMIQIWDVGQLSNQGESSATTASNAGKAKASSRAQAGEKTADKPEPFEPFMSLGICHNMGHALSIAWCPIPSPQPLTAEDLKVKLVKKDHNPAMSAASKSTSATSNSENTMEVDASGESIDENALAEFPRLGLLAVVLTSGSVIIYSVPHPQAIQFHFNGDRSARSPVLLHLNPAAVLTMPDLSPIVRVAWSPHGAGERIAAGSSDGKVAVWHLASDPEEEDDYLSDEETDGNVNSGNSNSATSSSRFDPIASNTKYKETDEPADSVPTCGIWNRTAMWSENPEDRELGMLSPAVPSLPLYLSKTNTIPIFFRNSHGASTTAIAWHPADPNLFAVATHKVSSYLWDVRQPACPRGSVNMGGGFVHDIAFGDSEVEHAWVAATDYGDVRTVYPPTTSIGSIHMAPCRTVDFSQMLRLRISAGLDGMVYLSSIVDSRPIKAHFSVTVKPIPGVWIERITQRKVKTEEGNEKILLRFAYDTTRCANELSPPDIEASAKGRPSTKGMTEEDVEAAKEKRKADKDANKKKKGAYRRKPNPSAEIKEILENELEAYRFDASPETFINRIRWSPNPLTPSWLAYGTVSGMVRVRLVPWACPYDMA